MFVVPPSLYSFCYRLFETIGKTELAKQTANYLHKDNPKVQHSACTYTYMYYELGIY